MCTGQIIVMNGPSGVGKTTLYKRLLNDFQDSIELSISATTRSPRSGEEDGRDYYFLKVDDFKKKIHNNEFVEWAKVYGNYYGTLKSELARITKKGEHVLLDIDVQGGESVKKAFPEAQMIFVLPPSRAVLVQRLTDRNTEDLQSLQKRIETSSREIDFFHNHKDLYSFSVINEDLELAYLELQDIIKSLL